MSTLILPDSKRSNALGKAIELLHDESSASRRHAAEGMGLLERRLASQLKKRPESRVLRSLQRSASDEKRLAKEKPAMVKKALDLKKQLDRRRNPKYTFPKEEFTPKVASGSILTFKGPPYNYQWIWRLRNDPFRESPEVSIKDGTFKAGVAGEHNDNWCSAAAGLGVPFRPVSEGLIRFSPYVRYHFNSTLLSIFIGAGSQGYLSIYIYSRPVGGGNSVVEVDKKLPLFNRHTTGSDDDFLDDEGVDVQFNETYFYGYPNRVYYCWVWGSASCYDDEGILWYYSRAWASMDARIPFMVFAQ